MKPRESQLPPPKLDMTPMIDVVFQLMIFFMLTLKIVTAEGNFDINMPLGGSGAQSDIAIPDIKVRLVSGSNGGLAKLQLGQRTLGNDARAFQALNEEILSLATGNKDASVEIDADYDLHYMYVIQAISACTGKVDPRTGQLIRYVEKIKFAPPRRPA
ncbi:MAG TPA: biopolymer transporter ExbD [Planctomycetaceae bacterium]|nr:biopolymer transporter ExbD [Planctomycetaceae bacterium]